jgi:hypothetical protein
MDSQSIETMSLKSSKHTSELSNRSGDNRTSMLPKKVDSDGKALSDVVRKKHSKLKKNGSQKETRKPPPSVGSAPLCQLQDANRISDPLKYLKQSQVHP